MTIKNRLSIIIPSRRERFLAPTVRDLLTHATGDVEIIVVLDGYWPHDLLKDKESAELLDDSDTRVVVLHKSVNLGMRPAINDAMRVATGEYLMKIDGHCAVPKGYDAALKADCDSDWLVVPRRYSLDAENWTIKKDRPTVDAHYLSYPFERPGDRTNGLHGNIWSERAKARRDVLIDDEMSSQGSCWFTTRQHWDRVLSEMDVASYGTFAQEFQEIGCKTWLSGGRVVVNKKTWYAHLHKGKQYGTGYGFSNARWDAWAQERERARLFTIDHWLYDRWVGRQRNFRWLLEKFWPVPGWPTDLDAALTPRAWV